MSSYKVVVCVTGSIAAYKSCELVSGLVQQGHSVKVIMSHQAQKFVAPGSFEALSKNPVWVDDFQQSGMDHIELGRWCDVCLVYPATAQTINTMACGVGGESINTFFLAYDFKKPFMIAPAMNSRMLQNPVTQKSICFLSEMGCEILPSEYGELACGEQGQGRLLSPKQTMAFLLNRMNRSGSKQKKVLITAGGTREIIDGVRTLTNMSTGETGAKLADCLHNEGYQVLLLTSQVGKKPKSKVKVDTYDSFRDIHNLLKALGRSHKFDMIVHAAAISDYSIGGIETPDGPITPGKNKIDSRYDKVSVRLERNEKILPRLKGIFGNETTVIGFKLTSTESKKEQAKAIFDLFTEDAVDYVVHNDMNDLNKGQRKFLMTSKSGKQEHLPSIENLAQCVSSILSVKNLVFHDPMP